MRQLPVDQDDFQYLIANPDISWGAVCMCYEAHKATDPECCHHSDRECILEVHHRSPTDDWYPYILYYRHGEGLMKFLVEQSSPAMLQLYEPLARWIHELHPQEALA